MMRKSGRLAIVLTIAIMMVASAALVVTAAADTTVGQFLQDLARAKSLNATDPQIAADSLAAAGVGLPAGLDLSATLTEGDVTSISRAAGLRVKATDPSATFSAEQVDRFFAVFSSDLNAGAGISTRSPGDCVVDSYGVCAFPGADCVRNGKPGFCQPLPGDCLCNTGNAYGKKKQVITPDEPE